MQARWDTAESRRQLGALPAADATAPGSVVGPAPPPAPPEERGLLSLSPPDSWTTVTGSAVKQSWWWVSVLVDSAPNYLQAWGGISERVFAGALMVLYSRSATVGNQAVDSHVSLFADTLRSTNATTATTTQAGGSTGGDAANALMALLTRMPRWPTTSAPSPWRCC